MLFHVDGDARPQHVISIRWTSPEGPIYVTREHWVQAEETYEPAPNVIDTRPALVLQRELVGTIDVRQMADTAALAAELARYVQLAVTGTSRLPITSVESPLPAFSFGRLSYAPSAAGQGEPVSDPVVWIERGLAAAASMEDQARTLELALRAAEPGQLGDVARAWQQRLDALGLSARRTVDVFRQIFNQVALTPYTGLVDNLVALGERLVELGHWGELERVDVFAFFLRQLFRHLTAFDLVTYHNQGANYPDALLLGAILNPLLACIERRPEWFLSQAGDLAELDRTKRLRRRALRGSWILARQYAGHRVPDLPTSPGENVRVLAGASYQVPVEQLQRSAARRRQLFETNPLQAPGERVARVLRQSFQDLDDPRELAELGTALYLDRPLGLLKQPGAVDRTPLVSYVAFSRSIATGRLELIGQGEAVLPARRGRLGDLLDGLLDRLGTQGLPVERLPERQGAGVVSLADALRTASDFRLLHSTRSSLGTLLGGYDLAPLAERYAGPHAWLVSAADVLAVRTEAQAGALAGEPFFTAFDGALRQRIQFALPRGRQAGYVERAGSEWLAPALRVTHVDGQACDVVLPAACCTRGDST